MSQFWYAYLYFSFATIIGWFEFNARTNWNTRNEKRLLNLARQPYQSTRPLKVKSAFLWELAYLARFRRMKRIWGRRSRTQNTTPHRESSAEDKILTRKRS